MERAIQAAAIERLLSLTPSSPNVWLWPLLLIMSQNLDVCFNVRVPGLSLTLEYPAGRRPRQTCH